VYGNWWPDWIKKCQALGTNGDKVVDVQQLWEQYIGHPRGYPVAFAVLLYFLLVVFATLFGGNVPSRGDIGFYADRLVLSLAIITFTWLLFYILHETRLCQHFIECLTKHSSKWPEGSIQEFAARLGLHDDAQDSAQDETGLPDWLTIQLFADRTQTVTNLIYFPFIVLALLIVSYLPVFDRWILSPELALVFLAYTALAVACVIKLRKAAEAGRQYILTRMKQKLPRAVGANKDARVATLQLLIGEVNNNHKGALRPISEQPLLKALLLPFAGAGSLILLENFTTV